MRPELLPWALALWLALALLVPKRSWQEVPARLRLVAAGQRRHLYGGRVAAPARRWIPGPLARIWQSVPRSEEHTSELQSR